VCEWAPSIQSVPDCSYIHINAGLLDSPHIFDGVMFISPGDLISLLYKPFNYLLPALTALSRLPCRFFYCTRILNTSVLKMEWVPIF